MIKWSGELWDNRQSVPLKLWLQYLQVNFNFTILFAFHFVTINCMKLYPCTQHVFIFITNDQSLMISRRLLRYILGSVIKIQIYFYWWAKKLQFFFDFTKFQILITIIVILLLTTNSFYTQNISDVNNIQMQGVIERHWLKPYLQVKSFSFSHHSIFMKCLIVYILEKRKHICFNLPYYLLLTTFTCIIYLRY